MAGSNPASRLSRKGEGGETPKVPSETGNGTRTSQANSAFLLKRKKDVNKDPLVYF